MTEKLADEKIDNVGGDTWTRFTGYCRMNRVLVGEKLTKILKDFMKKNLK
jgi:hypothetical protein